MDFDKLLHVFPPPHFLDVPFAGIVFSDSHVRVLVLDERSKRPVFWEEIPLQDGAIEAGVIKNEEQVVKIISEIASKLKTSFVKFAVPDEISYVFTAEVPVSSNMTVRESVAFILEENVPLPLSDTYFDFTPLSLEKGRDGFISKVAVTAISSSLVESYVSVIKKAGLEAICATSESQSIARSLVDKNYDGNSVILYSHRNTVGVYITEGRTVEFSSIVQLPPDSSAELFASFVSNEFSKALDYWKNKTTSGKKRVSKENVLPILVCGRSDLCQPIKGSLSNHGGLNVSIGNVWRNAFSLEEYIPGISFEDSLRFGGAVGLFV